MEKTMLRSSRCTMLLVGLPMLGLAFLAASAQPPLSPNERRAEKKESAEDRRDEKGNSVVWMLDFQFRDPRVIRNVNIPGRGPRDVWYLWYQVSNATGEDRIFIPNFVWVCHGEETVHHDKILPTAQQAIQQFEDPNRDEDVKNSVTISAKAIPNTPEFLNGRRIAFPRTVTGVAMWDDVNALFDERNQKLKDNPFIEFSIFVYGLSDGWTQIDGHDGKPLVRRKTLQLKFKRRGDEFNARSEEIEYLGHKWIYATSDLPPASKEEVKPAQPNMAVSLEPHLTILDRALPKRP
jgi:hypothetical protein